MQSGTPQGIWSVIELEHGRIVVRKELTHRRIEARKGINVTLGDDLVELWTVSFGPGGYLMEEVSW